MAKREAQLTLFPELPAAQRRSASRSRLFFALWPDSLLREKLAIATSTIPIGHSPAAYRVKPERYHLTLAFLGELGARQVEAALLAGAAVRACPFGLQLDQVGHFAGPNVVWIGPSTIERALAKLKGELDRELLRFGLRVERGPFQPHITCLRNIREPPDALIEPIEWRVQDFVLIHSSLGAAGKPARYRVLRRWPLTTGAAR